VISPNTKSLFGLIKPKGRMKVLKKAEFFVKKCYNIPEENPKDILDKILSEKD